MKFSKRRVREREGEREARMPLFLEVVKSLSDTRIDEDDGDDDDDLRERSSSSHTQQLLYSQEYERALSLSRAPRE